MTKGPRILEDKRDNGEWAEPSDCFMNQKLSHKHQ